MASKDLNPDSDSDPLQAPTLALKQALCFSCWNVSKNLSRCGACKLVAYCSKECQKQDWYRTHKEDCKKLFALNKQKGYVPSAGRHWEDYYKEQERLLFLIDNTLNCSALGRLIGYEPYCYHYYRRESQLKDRAKLNACKSCRLTAFCSSCQQAHLSPECAILQDAAADNRVMIDLCRRTGKSLTVSYTEFPRKQYFPLSSTTDWYNYYTRLSDKGGFKSKMNRKLRYLANDSKEREFVEYIRCGTNTTTIQLTLIATLETIIPNISTRGSINLYIIGPSGAEFSALPVFEELLHLLPSLKTLQLSFVGLNVMEGPRDGTKSRSIHKIQCYTMCYKTPDLAAAFHSGFAVNEEEEWYPTIRHLAHRPHPTLFTAARYFEIEREMMIWKSLGARFVKDAEVNKWKGMSPSLTVCGVEPNEVIYQNHWWYIVRQQ
ncbi:hypothetical protein HYFRA_00006721 [Hymenoscyphus fraxineus]|uniref:MYND-type domain-containing protein n=1 Tax=Hymenoscyphus fraxineus TaxID=746836 RepID=A0A9N9KUP8_9HELO|nr:hypothetical protein HYFRA_00006721 [Hymenoscyphus fraxineus]